MLYLLRNFMDTKTYVWKSEYGTWFLVNENTDNQFLHMTPITDVCAMRLKNRGVPLKEF